MNKDVFFKKLIDALELEESDLDENSALHLSSLMKLALMSFLDEHFGVRIKSADLNGIDSVEKLISLIGKDKIL